MRPSAGAHAMSIDHWPQERTSRGEQVAIVCRGRWLSCGAACGHRVGAAGGRHVELQVVIDRVARQVVVMWLYRWSSIVRRGR